MQTVSNCETKKIRNLKYYEDDLLNEYCNVMEYPACKKYLLKRELKVFLQMRVEFMPLWLVEKLINIGYDLDYLKTLSYDNRF